MNKILRSSLIAVATIAASLGVYAIASGEEITIDGAKYNVVGENLVANGDFDNGVQGWKTTSYSADALPENFALSEEGGYDGGAYITVSAAGKGAATSLMQSIAVEEGKTYVFTCYTSGKAPDAGNLQYQGLWAASEEGDHEGSKIKDLAWGAVDEWKLNQFVFTATTPYVNIRFSWNSGTKLDGISIYEIEEAGIDVSALADAIAAAEEVRDSYDEGSESYSIMNAAIETAQAAQPTTLEELQAAVKALKDAETDAKIATYANIAEGKYYIQNNESGLFLSNGAYWGTRSVLMDEGIEYDIVRGADGKYTLKSGIKNATNALRPSDGFNDQSGAWEIYPTDGGFLMFNGTQYFCNDASGVPTFKADADASCVWSLVTAAERKVLLNTATPENPVDATVYIQAPDFIQQATNNGVWSGSPKAAGDTGSGCTLANSTNAEKWNGGTFEVAQTITDLPNGIYQVSCQGFTRLNGATTASADSYEAGDVLPAYLFANEEQVALKSIFAEADAETRSGFAAVTATSGNVYYIANGQNTAAVKFNEGAYWNTVEVEVTDGTLKLGVKSEGGIEWVVFDSFRLTYLGVAPEPIVTPALVLGENEMTLNAHSNVSVKKAGALKVTFENMPQVIGATYAINEMNMGEDEEGPFWTVGAEVVAGEMGVNTIGYVEFENSLTFERGKKYQLTVTAFENTEEPTEVGTYTYEFNGAYEGWIAPVSPTLVGSDPVSGGKYYIMNVESGKFMAGMSTTHSWATTCGLNTNGQLSTLTETTSGWTIQRADNKYTFRSGDDELHVDMGSQGHNYFDFTKLENGNYTIASAASDDTYKGTGFWGYQPEAAIPHHIYANSTAENAYIEWAFVSEETVNGMADLINLYNKKLEVYNNATSLLTIYPESDIDAALAIYNTEGTTVADLQDAQDIINAEFVKHYANIASGDYVIQNVATGRYLNGGNYWGTKASATLHGQFMTFAQLEDGKYTIDSHHSNGGVNHFVNQGTDLYIDGAAVNHQIFAISEGIFGIMDPNGKFLNNQEDNIVNFNATEATESAQWRILSKEDIIAALNEATEEAPVDATALIGDANFSRNNTDISKWNTQPAKTGPNDALGATATGMAAEKWKAASFDCQQVITDLPNGIYELNFQGYYRWNNSDNNNADAAIAGHADGTEELNAIAYANDQQVVLASVADDDAVAAYGKAPNTGSEAAEAFTMGLFKNGLTVEVTDGTLTIGVKKEVAAGADWVVWDNFELYYLGVAPAVPVVTPAFILGEEETTLSEHIAVSVDMAEALKVTFENMPQVIGATYAINEMNMGEDEDGIFWTVGAEVVAGEMGVNTIGYAEFENALTFEQGKKYQLTVTAFENYEEPAEIGTYTYEFNGAYAETIIISEVELLNGEEEGIVLNGHVAPSVEAITAIVVRFDVANVATAQYAIQPIMGYDEETETPILGVPTVGELSVNGAGFAEVDYTFNYGVQYQITIEGTLLDETEFSEVFTVNGAYEPEPIEAEITVEGTTMNVAFPVGTDLGDNYAVKPYIMNGETKIDVVDYLIDNTTGGYFDPLNLIVITLSEELEAGNYTLVLPADMFFVNGGDNNAEMTYDFEVGTADAIKNVAKASAKNGKFVKGNNIVIVKNGKEYNVNGILK